MNNITLKIETSVIGTELTKTVDARELHKNLGVRKDFSNWIKGQITNLGLEEGFDFITLALKGVGGKFDRIDYTLTLDTAKHISMASRTLRGKEVRNYFIEAEKKLTQIGEAYRAQPQNQNAGIDLSPLYAIMEMQTQLLQSISNQNTAVVQMLQSVNVQNSLMIEMMDKVQNTNEMNHMGIRIILNTIEPKCIVMPLARNRIGSEQRKFLYDLIYEKGMSLSHEYSIKSEVMVIAMFGMIKREFSVRHYSDITINRFDEAVTRVTNYDPTV